MLGSPDETRASPSALEHGGRDPKLEALARLFRLANMMEKQSFFVTIDCVKRQ